ncbi:hypothetical protein LY76DRAFT_193766 [Colletotrichum caudatum]|nr:hypothetical protein LY76DRAFT_193766 [Colletotrichum caudatum]
MMDGETSSSVVAIASISQCALLRRWDYSRQVLTALTGLSILLIMPFYQVQLPVSYLGTRQYHYEHDCPMCMIPSAA